MSKSRASKQRGYSALIGRKKPEKCIYESKKGRRHGMKSKCSVCGCYWNTSILQQIPKTGYICPWCGSRKRASRWPSQRLKTKNIIAVL